MKFIIAFNILLVSAVALSSAQHQVDCSYRRPGCFCPEVWDPVCATNGCTYGNICKMGCAGAALNYKGECRKC